jgi:hypothetical protein
VNTTLLQQLNQNLRLIAQGMAQAGAALLDAPLFPSLSVAAGLQSQPALQPQPASPSPLFALPLHHLGACVQLNIRGETPQGNVTS